MLSLFSFYRIDFW